MVSLNENEFIDLLFSVFFLSKETNEFKTRKTFFAPSEYGEKNYYSTIKDFVQSKSREELKHFIQKFDDSSFLDFHIECEFFSFPIAEFSVDFVAKKEIRKGQPTFVLTHSVFLVNSENERGCLDLRSTQSSIDSLLKEGLPKEIMDFFIFNLHYFS